jgi:2-polyprenyl-6-methoxyphenol hydroxylase-like FAD-dependent oxidoreductase
MTHDVVVCGTGPAGGVVARRLALAGVRVAQVGMPSRPGWEGLSARSRALLADEGLDGTADVIAGPIARQGVWANGRPVAGIEWLVERSRLAAAVSAAAASAGVLHRADVVTHTQRVGGCWNIRLRGGGMLAAPLIIDARGRRGPQLRGPLLLAMGQRLRRGGASGSIATSATGIGVADFGWCWWAEHGQTLWVQVTGRPRAGHPAAWLTAAAAQIPALARALEGASIWGEPTARPAHARLGVLGRDPSCWHVGDAALALDPLSGQGIYEALRGARLVAAAVQSVMDGGDAPLARRFITERHEEAWLRAVRVAEEFYRENCSHGAFWRDTAAAYAALLPAAAPPRQAAEAARIERRPVLDRGRILEREVIITANHPRGVWHIGGVPLASLKHYFDAAEHATIDGAALALDRPPAAIATAIHWLQQVGHILRPQPSVSSGG